MKTPKWCKDEGKQPYKICWGYANNLKDFEFKYCKDCEFYQDPKREELRQKILAESKSY